jgi:hypothetical protein
MLKQVLAPFYELIDRSRQRVGDSAPKIADEVLAAAFPQTHNASELEGCDRMLRNGVINAVKAYIRKPPADERQRSFEDIAPQFMPLVENLGSTSYYVPSLHGGEYVGVGELIAKPELLEAAQKFMQLKAEENAEEARRLGELLEAVRTYG